MTWVIHHILANMSSHHKYRKAWLLFQTIKVIFHLPLIVNASSSDVRVAVFSTVLYHKISHLNVFSSFIWTNTRGQAKLASSTKEGIKHSSRIIVSSSIQIYYKTTKSIDTSMDHKLPADLKQKWQDKKDTSDLSTFWLENFHAFFPAHHHPSKSQFLLQNLKMFLIYNLGNKVLIITLILTQYNV